MNEKLCSAVEQESCVDVRILLEQGADPLAFTTRGMNAIGISASNGNVTILSRLLEHITTGQDTNSRSTMVIHGSTPDGMDDLEWDEEIDPERIFSPDKEWLDLYRCVGRSIQLFYYYNSRCSIEYQ